MLNYFVGPLLFVWLSYSIYQQVMQQKDLHQSWQIIVDTFKGPGKWRVYFACLLMIFNWGLEAKKWQLLMRPIQHLTFTRAFRAVFSGQALALGTPNRVGEYVGRIVYLNDGNRLRALSLSAVGSMAQILVTFIMGLLGMVYVYSLIETHAAAMPSLSAFWLQGLLSVIFFGTILLLLLYYKLAWVTMVLERIPIIKKYRFFIQKLERLHNKELTKILFLSFVRYLVYVLQYLLIYQFFGIGIDWWQVICLVCVQLLVMTIIPSIALAELGIRGKVSIALFGLLTNNTLGIIATAASIWLINLIIPALAGSLLILGLRIVRK
ncbi:lysylphosphatidylglycerol synthase domain-containing protein [Parasediminibacterium sp. JCM 36343]|uniref:lysylphosphatidylglycerol synthase domain-containing protein n=1 Tax=Parasediminibacterium sp. JCM 36343 TaxID=3374279 RepID=UPI00397B3F7F